MKNEIDNKFTELPKIFSMLIEKVVADNKEYSNINEWFNSLPKKEGNFTVILNPVKTEVTKIIVKEQALSDTPFFKFNKFYNNDKPIPMTEMYGIKIEEKDKMVKMDLWDKDHKIHWVGWLLKNWFLEGKI